MSSVEWMTARHERLRAESPEVLLEVVRLPPEAPGAGRSTTGRSARKNRRAHKNTHKNAVSEKTFRKRRSRRRAATPPRPNRPEQVAVMVGITPEFARRDAVRVSPPVAEPDPESVRDIRPAFRLPTPPGDNFSEATALKTTALKTTVAKNTALKAPAPETTMSETTMSETTAPEDRIFEKTLPPDSLANPVRELSRDFSEPFISSRAREKRANSLPSAPGPSPAPVTARVSGGSGHAGSPGLTPRRPEMLDAGFGLVGGAPRPLYPEQARRLGRGGSVVLDILVGPDGKVMRVVVVRESLGWGFGAAARKAYAKAVFTPPRANGRPVRVLWRKTLRFRP